MMPITILGGELDRFKFPGGETHIRVKALPEGHKSLRVWADLETADDIMALLLLADALKRKKIYIDELILPYVPYARQDRVCNPGEPLSIAVMAELINSIGAAIVTIIDPHSDVTPALINDCRIIHQHEIVPASLLESKTIICPDAGAEKKVAKLKRPYILCTKERDTATGDILRTIVHHHGSLEGRDCIIIDDICDGGRTFIEIAKVLQLKNAGRIELFVTHGIFSKGKEVFDGVIDQVYYYEDGEVKCLL